MAELLKGLGIDWRVLFGLALIHRGLLPELLYFFASSGGFAPELALQQKALGH